VIALVLVGAAGRMGRAVSEAVATAPDVELRASVDRAANPGGSRGVWSHEAGDVIRAGDVVVDFSSPEGAPALAALCAERGVPLVIGTTGLTAEDHSALRAAATRVAVLHAANFSLGAAALKRVLAAALAAVPASWDIEIVERHHRMKADAPSGTALALAEVARAARGATAALRHGREGRVGARPDGEIGMHAVRGGSWVGDHAVLLAGAGESLEVRHVVESRAAFASGALAAARFVAGRPAGLYTLDDVLGV